MSTITVPNLQIGDGINSKPINTFISTVNGFTATADNFKPEGIDRRNIQPQITHDYRYWRDDPAVPYVAGGNSFHKLNNGAQNIEIGPVTVPAGQSFQVCASFNFIDDTLNVSSSSRGATRVTFKIGYDSTDAHGTSSNSYLPKTFGVIAQQNSMFVRNANCCTLEVMQNPSTIERTYTFYILAQSSTYGQVFPNNVLIDSLSFFYVRYLV